MTGAAFVGAWSVAPSPGGAGGGTTPAFGHPSRPPRPSGTPPKEGNGGECAWSVSVCGKTVHPSPATLASSLVSAWRGRGDVSTSPATTPDPSDAPPASRPACKPTRPKIRTTTHCRRATPNLFRKPPRPEVRSTMCCRRGTPRHSRRQCRSRDIPLLSGGVAEGRGGRPATAVRPLPTPPAPPLPSGPKSCR